MAGGSATATGAGGFDGSDQRSGKNYGGDQRSGKNYAPSGRGRPPRPYGRGRGRYQQGGRGKQLRGDGFGINPVAATSDGDYVSHPRITKDRNNKGKEMVEGSNSMAGKHKGSQMGEPAAKKKRNFVLCCEICEEEHFTPQCPLLHGPKPTATFSGLAGEGLGFFHIPYTKMAKAPQKVSATALISIIEGSVPAELVKKELARAIPIKWDWEVCEHGNNTYIVPFPCQVELQRMISMKRLRTDNNEGVMLFEEWNNEIKPKQKLQKVWVQVYGVPYEIRSFLPLWAVGSILGVTQRVDMRYLKKTGVVRLMVAVLDVNCIPDDADIVVDDSLYEIFFKVEHIVPANGDDPEDFDDEDDLDPNNHHKDTDQEMEDMENQTKNGSSFSGPSNGRADFKSCSKSTQAPTDEAPPVDEVQIAQGPVDKAVPILLDDTSASVVAEIDKSSDVYSAAIMQLVGPNSGESLVQEIGRDHPVPAQSNPLSISGTGASSWEHVAVLPRSDNDIVLSKPLHIPVQSNCFGQSGEDANGCNGPKNSVVASPAGQEAELCSGQQDPDSSFEEVVPVSAFIEDDHDCAVVAPVVMKENNPSTIFNFHELPRFALQALCKKNGIRANITNVAMANALQFLDGVVGVEDLRGYGGVVTVPSADITAETKEDDAVVAVPSAVIAADKKEDDKKNNNEEKILPSISKQMVHLRRSQRSSTMSDEHTLKKVERRVAACNLEFTGFFQGNILAAVLGIAAA